MAIRLETPLPRRDNAPGPFPGRPLIEGHPEALVRINDPDVDMVIWARDVPGVIKDWLGTLAWDDLPSGRVLIKPEEASAVLVEILDRSSTPKSLGADMFIADAADMVSRFAEIAGCNLVDVRVDAIRHDACWRFHRDCVPFRLITTYLGPGTEFVDPADSERALQDQKTFAGKVHRVPSFAVSVFKGSRSVDGAGIVHRSPPIARTGQHRLVLCLNTPSITSPPR